VTDKHARGHLILGMGKYIQEELDPALRGPVQARCAHVLSRLGEVERTGWYPLQDVVDLYEALYKQFDDPQGGFNALWRAGHYVASDAAGTFLKLLLKVLTPRLFARQFPEIWRRYHDFGELRPDMRDLDKNKVYFTMPGYPFVPPVTAGWLEYLFTGFGMKEVVVDVKVPPAGPWPDEVEFVVSWSGS
jgi:hypothetical protein